jgi:hypothetical protein
MEYTMPNVPRHTVLPSMRLLFEDLERRERAGIATGGATLSAFMQFFDKLFEVSRPGTVRGTLIAMKKDFDKSARRTFKEAVAKMYAMLDIIDRHHSELGVSFEYLNTLFTNIMTGTNSRATNLNKRLAVLKYGYTKRRRNSSRRSRHRHTRRERR